MMLLSALHCDVTLSDQQIRINVRPDVRDPQYHAMKAAAPEATVQVDQRPIMA
jgi:hypothetical protein